NEPFLSSPDGRILRILSEYSEPLSRFRREQIQDTVVFFGSARFHPHEDASAQLAELRAARSQGDSAAYLKRAHAAAEMSRYYDDARKLAFMLTECSIKIPARRRRLAVTTRAGAGLLEAASR